MELREYLAIRRSYNLIRQQMSAKKRLTFVEFAILSRLRVHGDVLNTSQIADYQGALRPTMTHRTKHLSDLELLERTQGSSDRRNVVCGLTELGASLVDEVCTRMCMLLRSGSVLSRTTPQRICRYVDAMGAVTCMSGELVLLGITMAPDGQASVSELVRGLGLLQPTVSMSISTLVEQGLAYRVITTGGSRLARVALTEEGNRRAGDLIFRIRQLVVHRG